MANLKWMKTAFPKGYRSGDILSKVPDARRKNEEKRIGGSYRVVFQKAILPYLKKNSRVLEIGPGKGSWTKAILKYIPKGVLHTVDFQDAQKWLNPSKYGNRLVCKQINKIGDYSKILKNNYFDFCFSFGILCHHNKKNIEDVLREILPKMKRKGISVHQYGDWDKLDTLSWKKMYAIPKEFKLKKESEIWWPKNNPKIMSKIATKLGYKVLSPDLGILKRDSIIVLQKN